MFLSLMYHNVVEDGFFESPRGTYARLSPSITSYFLEESAFRQHIAWLQRETTPLTLSDVRNELLPRVADAPFRPDVIAAPTRSWPERRPRVQVTFDDGWKESVDRAGPILAEAGMEALVFVTTDLIGKPMFLSRGELQRLPAHYRIGSHARTHDFLNELSETAIREELVTSRKVLEDITGKPVDTISIPNGAIDARVRRIAVEADYRLIYTSDVHANGPQTGPLAIGRIAIRDTTTAAHLENAISGTGLSSQSLRRGLLNIPKTILGPRRYRRLRGWLIGERSDQLEMTDLGRGRGTRD